MHVVESALICGGVLGKFSEILADPYMFDDHSIDLVYVDGDHSYEAFSRI